MAERFKAADLKSVVCKSTRGSNPFSSSILLCSSMAEQLTVNQHVRGSNPLLAANDIDMSSYDVFMSLIFSFLYNLNKNRTK